MNSLINWDAEDFGNRVHESSVGSWVPDGHDDAAVD